VRYRLTAVPFDAGYCHCSICRRSSGAPVIAFATVPLADFEITAGSPRVRRSTAFGERWFCADCGTQLAMRVDHQPDTIDFTIGSLDDPAALSPTFHIFFGEHTSSGSTAQTACRATRGSDHRHAASSKLSEIRRRAGKIAGRCRIGSYSHALGAAR
jgi:hypothetical protein